MKRLLGWYVRFKTSEKGASATEYALIIALVAIVIIAGATALGGAINSMFNAVATTISEEIPAT